MQEIRCSKCNRLLLKAEIPYKIETKCPKCKTVQTQGKTEPIEFYGAKVFSNMIVSGKVMRPSELLNTNKKESVENGFNL
jgi:phage FluMu protein Com